MPMAGTCAAGGRRCFSVGRLSAAHRPGRAAGLLLDKVADQRDFVRWQTMLEPLWGIPVLGGLESLAELRGTIESLRPGEEVSRDLCRTLANNLLCYASPSRLLQLAAQGDFSILQAADSAALEAEDRELSGVAHRDRLRRCLSLLLPRRSRCSRIARRNRARFFAPAGRSPAAGYRPGGHRLRASGAVCPRAGSKPLPDLGAAAARMLRKANLRRRRRSGVLVPVVGTVQRRNGGNGGRFSGNREAKSKRRDAAAAGSAAGVRQLVGPSGISGSRILERSLGAGARRPHTVARWAHRPAVSAHLASSGRGKPLAPERRRAAATSRRLLTPLPGVAGLGGYLVAWDATRFPAAGCAYTS